MKRQNLTTNPLTEIPTAFHSFAKCFLPWLGVSELEKAIVNISTVLELPENRTADAITALQKEVSQLAKIAIQDRKALDMLLDLKEESAQ